MPNSSNSDNINLNPTDPDDKIDYNQEQKHGIVEIFVTLRLPIKAYECAYGIHRIANYKSFDDYVSDCVIQDLGLLKQGEISDDLIHSKLTGKSSRWMQEQNKHWNKVNENLT